MMKKHARSLVARLALWLGAPVLLASAWTAGGCGAFDPKPAGVVGADAISAPEPRPGEKLMNRAQDLAARGDLEEARKEFERIIAINPTLTVAYLGAGDIYRQEGDYKTAEQRYGKAAELEPGNFDAQYLHGLSLQLLNRLGEAVRAYLRALTIRPDDFYANLYLGTAYLQLGEGQQALSYAQRAVKLDPNSAAARTNLGAVYAALDRHAEAVTEYQQAAELAKLSPPLLLNLADSLGKIGRYEEMVNTVQQLVEMQPTASAQERLGSGYFRLKKYPEAEAAFRKSMEMDPNYYPALNGAAVCALNRYVWSNQADEAAKADAVALLRRSLVIEKRQPRVIDLLSRYK